MRVTRPVAAIANREGQHMSEESRAAWSARVARLLAVGACCAIAGAPRAAQDDGAPAAVPTVTLAVFAGLADGSGEVRPLREPQIVTARLAPPPPAAVAPVTEATGAGTTLAAFGLLIAWIAGRRR